MPAPPALDINDVVAAAVLSLADELRNWNATSVGETALIAEAAGRLANALCSYCDSLGDEAPPLGKALLELADAHREFAVELRSAVRRRSI